MDDERRRLERAAAEGDLEAKGILKQLRRRLFDPSQSPTHEEKRKFPRPLPGSAPTTAANYREWRKLVEACGRGSDKSHGGRDNWRYTPRGHSFGVAFAPGDRLPFFLRFSAKHDAWWCTVCNRWLESRCIQPSCAYCPSRPTQPSQVREDMA